MADALISPTVGFGGAVLAGALLLHACRRVARDTLADDRRLPLMGVLGAFVFAAQMINFAIPGTGSSGHIGGGMLLALLVGPWAAFVVMASILTVQCLLFADGGLLALGCNILNLGVWPAFVGLPLYQWLVRRTGRPAPACVAAVVVSLLAGATGVVVQTLLSGRSELPVGPFLALMLGIHLPIAIIEGLITVGVLAAVRRMQPDVATAPPTGGWRGRVVVGLLAGSLLVGGIGAWFASSRPDGLEDAIGRIAGTTELPARNDAISTGAALAQERIAVMPDYALPAAAEEGAEAEAAWPAISGGTSLAGIVGAAAVLLVVAALVALSAMAARRRTA